MFYAENGFILLKELEKLLLQEKIKENRYKRYKRKRKMLTEMEVKEIEDYISIYNKDKSLYKKIMKMFDISYQTFYNIREGKHRYSTIKEI